MDFVKNHEFEKCLLFQKTFMISKTIVDLKNGENFKYYSRIYKMFTKWKERKKGNVNKRKDMKKQEKIAYSKHIQSGAVHCTPMQWHQTNQKSMIHPFIPNQQLCWEARNSFMHASEFLPFKFIMPSEHVPQQACVALQHNSQSKK